LLETRKSKRNAALSHRLTLLRAAAWTGCRLQSRRVGGLTRPGIAAERAVDLMRWRLANCNAPPMKWNVPGQLILRESTGADQ